MTERDTVDSRSFPPWVIGSVATFFVFIAYFASARLGLALLTEPDGVAVFWPAAGVSAGLLIGRGRQPMWPVLIGVAGATIAANLLGDRNIWSSTVFACCNAFEAAVIALLIERYFGPSFELTQMRRVIGFIIAAIVGCAASGIGGTAGYLLFHPSTAPAVIIWEHWFTSDLIGVVSVAPFVIGLSALRRDALSPQEITEGLVGLVLLAGACSLFIVLPQAPWDDVAIVSLLPLLLWLAAHGRPIFAAAGAFVIALAIVCLTTWQIDFFGVTANLPAEYRILTAQVFIVSCVLCALVLGALFSERRRHMSLLVESELRLQSALEAGRAIAFDWSPRGDYSKRSKNATQILGLDAAHGETGRRFLDRIHPDDRLRFKARLRALNPVLRSYAMEFRYVRADGKQVWLEETGKAEFDSAGRLVQIGGLTVDVTERKQFEETLARAQKSAERANRSKSAFLAAASHDLRQPLQTLQILHGTLRSQIAGNDTRQSIDAIGRSLATMSDMLASLLDINQLESGTIRPELSDFPVNDIFQSLAADFAEALRQRGLPCQFMRSGLAVRSDRRMLKEIIRNLLSNAIRYTEKGRILVGCRRVGDSVRIEVWDSGVGIMGEHLPRIFDEYFQGPQIEPGGFGLGLALVQRLGDMLGHQVDVRSTPGKGSGFSITVPIGLASSPASVVARLPAAKSESIGAYTILAIEDEGSVRDAMENWLRSQGLDVVSVPNGREALAMVNGKHFDLVLSDYNLPGEMNGIDSIRALRAAFARKIPAIVLTGDTRSGLIESISKHDVGIGIKPMKMDELMALITSQLSNRAELQGG